jgi:large subunit ribosomal protein L30
MSGQRLKVTLVRSKQGRGRIQLACVNGLGLRRVNHSVELIDSAAIRGMINKVSHLVKVEEIVNEA